jgi:dTDP-4-dehydrorhamnose reductase
MAMKILVTGAEGQLGKELGGLLSDPAMLHSLKDADVVYTDAAELDITDMESIKGFRPGFVPEIIINCAAFTAVDAAEEQQELCFAVNATGPANLARHASDVGALLVHISTDYVFDGKNCVPYTEEDTRVPLGVYGVSKARGEELIEESGADFVIIRTSWLYSGEEKNFFKTILDLASRRDSLSVVFDQTGTPTLAKELAGAIVTVCERYSGDRVNFPYGIYHYSNEGVCSWYDFACEIVALSGNSCVVSPVTSSEYPAKSPRPSFSVLDKSKIKRNFGIRIPHWRRALEDFYRCKYQEDKIK